MFKKVIHEQGSQSLLITKDLPGERWIKILTEKGFALYIGEDNDGKGWSKDDLKKMVSSRNFSGVICQLSETWDKELLQFAHNRGIGYLSNYAVGYNNIDVEEAEELGIKVTNTPGVLTETTAECAVALTCSAARRVAELDCFTRKGLFKGIHPNLGLGQMIENSVTGVVGLGRIGLSYAMKMGGLGSNIYYYTRSGKNEEFHRAFEFLNQFRMKMGKEELQVIHFDNLDKMLPLCDIVSLHVPLTEKTHYLMNQERLNLLKKNCILINTARGKVIDEKKLVELLKEKRIFSAGLDVYENEPELSPGLSDLENTVLLPHVGSASRWTRESMAVMAALNLRGMILGHRETDDFNGTLKKVISGENPDMILSLVHS